MMRTIRAILLAIPLAGCGQGFHDQMSCRHSAGREPGTELMLFGLAGAIAMSASDDHKAWQQSVDVCLQSVRLARAN